MAEKSLRKHANNPRKREVADKAKESEKVNTTNKKHTELQNADDCYKKVQEWDAKLAKLQKEIDRMAISIAEDKEQKAMYEEALSDLKEKYEGEKSQYEEAVVTALASYVKYYEKESKTLIKQRDNYEKYIKEEQARLEKLQAEITAIEGDEDQTLLLNQQKQDYEELKLKIDKMSKTLENFNERIAALDSEMQQAKEKYKDYMDRVHESIKEEKESKKEEPKEVNEKKSDDKEKDSNKDKEEKNVDDKKVDEEKEEKDNVGSDTKNAETPNKTDEKKTPETDELDIDEETDEQAFNRIYKQLSKRSTRKDVTDKDLDKMIEIMSNKDNYSKFNISTKRFLNLPIFPASKAEKIFKQIGLKLAFDVNIVAGMTKQMEVNNKYRLSNFGELNEWGSRPLEEKMDTQKDLEAALKAAKDPETIELISGIKDRVDRYRGAMTALRQVKDERNENVPNANTPLLNEGKEEVVVEVKEQTTLSETLGKNVLENPEPPTSKALSTKEKEINFDIFKE